MGAFQSLHCSASVGQYEPDRTKLSRQDHGQLEPDVVNVHPSPHYYYYTL